jgi:hypothetical protein
MNDRDAPYRLQEGLFLEKRGTLLEWNASQVELEKTADKKKNAHWDGSADLSWYNEKVLGGLPVHVQRCARDTKGFDLFLAEPPFFEKAIDGAFVYYHYLLPILIERLGQPEFESRTPDFRGYASPSWIFGEITVFLIIFDRFGPNFSFSASKGV